MNGTEVQEKLDVLHLIMDAFDIFNKTYILNYFNYCKNCI